MLILKAPIRGVDFGYMKRCWLARVKWGEWSEYLD